MTNGAIHGLDVKKNKLMVEKTISKKIEKPARTTDSQTEPKPVRGRRS